ncbi:MAG TPA: hypothetical protein VKV39_07525 [Candidatus Sulfotelmatobacter sp.]|nr:hypothetical protein [Candidatus Sulfotelmatobacter sp.]
MQELDNFEDWRSELERNCEKQGQSLAFSGLNDYVLRLLWAKRIEPTPQAIIQDAERIS